MTSSSLVLLQVVEERQPADPHERQLRGFEIGLQPGEPGDGLRVIAAFQAVEGVGVLGVHVGVDVGQLFEFDQLGADLGADLQFGVERMVDVLERKSNPADDSARTRMFQRVDENGEIVENVLRCHEYFKRIACGSKVGDIHVDAIEAEGGTGQSGGNGDGGGVAGNVFDDVVASRAVRGDFVATPGIGKRRRTRIEVDSDTRPGAVARWGKNIDRAVVHRPRVVEQIRPRQAYRHIARGGNLNGARALIAYVTDVSISALERLNVRLVAGEQVVAGNILRVGEREQRIELVTHVGSEEVEFLLGEDAVARAYRALAHVLQNFAHAHELVFHQPEVVGGSVQIDLVLRVDDARFVHVQRARGRDGVVRRGEYPATCGNFLLGVQQIRPQLLDRADSPVVDHVGADAHGRLLILILIFNVRWK